MIPIVCGSHRAQSSSNASGGWVDQWAEMIAPGAPVQQRRGVHIGGSDWGSHLSKDIIFRCGELCTNPNLNNGLKMIKIYENGSKSIKIYEIFVWNTNEYHCRGSYFDVVFGCQVFGIRHQLFHRRIVGEQWIQWATDQGIPSGND